MASLKDIASALDVSVVLVSRVLSNRMGTTKVSPGTAEAIRQKAIELNYQKNVSAFSLSTGRHNTIGAFIHREGEFGSSLLERLVMGIAEEARETEQKLILAFYETKNEFLKLSKSSHRGVMDGLILGGHFHHELAEKIYEIAKGGIPVVTLYTEPIHPKIINLSVSEQAIGYVATKHLIDQGCRRIGHIRAQMATDFRYKGYCQAMNEAGLEVRSSWVFNADKLGFSLAAGEAFAHKIIKDKIVLDGLTTESDQQTLGAMNVFLAASVRIPEDIKLIGVDDSPFCQFLPIQLSSVSGETVKRGRLAMDLLLKMRDGKEVKNISLDPVLKIRRSSGGK
jgi:LacI family transcriptional regulator